MAAERAQAGLPLGRSRAESEALLQATEEAAAAQLPLEGEARVCMTLLQARRRVWAVVGLLLLQLQLGPGVKARRPSRCQACCPHHPPGMLDLRPAIEAAQRGWCLNAKQLEGVAASLEAALRLRATACAPAAGDPGRPAFPLLAGLAAGIAREEADTLAALRACVRGGSVTDEADAALAATRAERAANLASLRSLVAGLARDLAAKGAAEGREPMLVRGRFCVGVRSNRRSELPKGSVKLGASASGATVYMEPAPAVELNNLETELAAREEEQVVAVLARLSGLLSARSPQLASLLEAVTQLDIAAARARHAAWLGGVKPAFVDW